MEGALIVWSARVVVALYLARVAIDCLYAESPNRDRITRWIWTSGCALFVLHVAFAFQFLHGWSHASALAHVSQRTFEVVGIHWGGGIYVNYAFMILWIADVVVWWVRAASQRPAPAWLFWSVHAIFAFLMFNATVVFGPPFWKWIVSSAVLLFVAAWFLSRRALNLRRVRNIEE